jgi:protein-disulfide isomerase
VILELHEAGYQFKISRVKSTPTVMIGERRVEGVVSRDEILQIMKNAKISEAG